MKRHELSLTPKNFLVDAIEHFDIMEPFFKNPFMPNNPFMSVKNA